MLPAFEELPIDVTIPFGLSVDSVVLVRYPKHRVISFG